MNYALIKSLPTKINHLINESNYLQGYKIIKTTKLFEDKDHLFSNTLYNVNKPSTSTSDQILYKTNQEINKPNINIKTFLELLMFITNDYTSSKEDFKKLFIGDLEKSNDNLKVISHKYRILKLRIVDVIEDKILICDDLKCMQFFAKLLNMNIIIFLVHNAYSEYIINENKDFKTITIFRNLTGEYDFKINHNNPDKSKLIMYLSKLLIQELSLEQIKNYAKNYKIDCKGHTKASLILKLNEKIYLSEL
jgi:hypothetical protein